MWWAIRRRELGVKFRRQHPIGPYIVDFVCLEQHLVVEVDGQHHGGIGDQLRDRELKRRGFRVARFWNHDIFTELDAVLEEIALLVEDG